MLLLWYALGMFVQVLSALNDTFSYASLRRSLTFMSTCESCQGKMLFDFSSTPTLPPLHHDLVFDRFAREEPTVTGTKGVVPNVCRLLSIYNALRPIRFYRRAYVVPFTFCYRRCL
jgi:hypothetical protein